MMNNIKAGVQLPRCRKEIEQRQIIDRYAKVSSDYDPIHINGEFAVKSQFNGIFAHGMLVLAYLSQILPNAFDQNWFYSSRLDIRFKTPARPGDILVNGGIIREVRGTGGGRLAICDISYYNQWGEPVILGKVSTKL
jgi:3-hydroxybutyryl-CoA dehydratase